MFNKIVIAGGNGFLGTSLAEYFSARCKSIVIVSRKPIPVTANIQWMHWDGINLGKWT